MKTWTEDATAQMERYLRQVQVLLEGGGADAREVVEDLRNHILQQGEMSAHVVINGDELRQILQRAGCPEEVASSWKELGAESWEVGGDISTPKTEPPGVARLAAGHGLKTAAIALLIALPFVLLFLYGMNRATPEDKLGHGGESIRTDRVESGASGETARAIQREMLGILPQGWFQAGTNHVDYETGTAGEMDEMTGDAVFIRSRSATAGGFSTVMREIPAAQFRGKNVTLAGTIETDLTDGGKAQLWMRIDAPDGAALGFDNMGNRPIMGKTPAKGYSISLDVPVQSERIAYGVLMTGTGTTWFDPAMKLETSGFREKPSGS